MKPAVNSRGGTAKENRAEAIKNSNCIDMRALAALIMNLFEQSMAVVAPFDTRLQGTDFAQLIARAQSQHDRVDERRLEWAKIAFGTKLKAA